VRGVVGAVISWFHYVRYSDLLLAMAYGWQPVADLGDTHGQWSVLCQWIPERKRGSNYGTDAYLFPAPKVGALP
jgi:invasion protein IalB